MQDSKLPATIFFLLALVSLGFTLLAPATTFYIYVGFACVFLLLGLRHSPRP